MNSVSLTVRTKAYDDALAQRSLDKLARAMRRGTGCYLRADEIEALRITHIGEFCNSGDKP